VYLCNQIIYDSLTEDTIRKKRSELQIQGMDVAIAMKQSQDVITTLSNICQ
ncbi:unnamed protein product, partial [Candidula unifasciata]